MRSYSVPPNRPTWNQYFLEIAQAVAARADCSRRKVGAVIVRDNRIVATGYNGSSPGGPSCLAGECPRAQSGVEPNSSYDTGPGACVAIHAEANAILYAGIDGCRGSTLYCTDWPCDGCMKLINAAGIVRVVSSELDTVEGIPYPVPGKDMDAALELLHAQGNHNHDLALDAHRGRSCHLCALIVRSTLDDNESRGGAA